MPPFLQKIVGIHSKIQDELGELLYSTFDVEKNRGVLNIYPLLLCHHWGLVYRNQDSQSTYTIVNLIDVAFITS